MIKHLLEAVEIEIIGDVFFLDLAEELVVLDGTEPVEGVADIDESVLGVSAEVLAGDGQQSTSVVAAGSR